MKILVVHVGTPIDPAKYPGEEIYQEPTLTHGLQFFRYAEVVNNMQTRQSLATQGVEVNHIYFTGRKNPINCIKASWVLRQKVFAEKYDLVNQYWGGISSFFAALFCPCIYIVSLLGSDLYGQYKPNGSKTFMGQILSVFSQLTAVLSTGIIVMSEKMKQKVWGVSRRKAVAICEGISPNKFYPTNMLEARQKLGWEIETPVVLFFPSEAYVKNTPLAKKTFEILQNKMPEAKLILVQGVPHQDLIWYYNAADLLLITSYHEGSNNSIKEALACNLPVVSVNVGDAAERLQNVLPSAVVNNFNANDLAEAMLPILQNKKRCNGNELIHEVELPNIAAKIVGFYNKLLQEKNK